MFDWGASLSILQNQNIWIYVGKGILFTVIISVIAVAISVFFGSILALVRNYCTCSKKYKVKYILLKIIRSLSVIYIEVSRNTPLLLWIFICVVFCPVPELFSHKLFGLTSVETKLLFKAAIALILFESSVIAEIIRGGLNSVDKGQFEAGHSQGFSIFHIFIYIILPQAYRNIVPTLLSQVISTVKDSSYLANVAVIELMARTKQILSSAGVYNGSGNIYVSDVFVLFSMAMIIYFVINYTLSCIVRYMQKQNRKQPKAINARG